MRERITEEEKWAMNISHNSILRQSSIIWLGMHLGVGLLDIACQYLGKISDKLQISGKWRWLKRI